MGNGKFIGRKLLDKKLEMFIGLDNEWLSYADGDVQAYTIIVATPKEYDEDSGVLTMQNDLGQTFFMHEDVIQMFWLSGSGFTLIENTSSTIRTGKQWLGTKKDRDIM